MMYYYHLWYSSIELIIEFLGVLVLVAPIIIAIYTLRELKKQRENSYMPDIYFSSYPSFTGSIEPDNSSNYERITYWEKDEERH